MIRNLNILACVFIFNLNLTAQQIITDRPDQTESSSTIPVNSIQIEAGLLIENYSDNTRQQTQLPGVLLRYGLMEGFELRLGQQLLNDRSKAGTQADFGTGDIELGAKIQIFQKENINTEIAFLSHLIIPSGMEGLSNESFGIINKLAISHSLNESLSFGYNIGYDYLGEGSGDLSYSAAFGAGLSEKIGAYIELFGAFIEFDQWESNFDSGLTYLLQDNLQLDLSFGLGLNYKMSYFSAGVSWNINHHK